MLFKNMLFKKILKRILFTILALILVLISTAAFAYLRYLYPTGEIMPGLYAIRNDRNGMPMVNFFIMQADEKYIAFDAGSDGVQTQYALQRLGISVDDVIAVFVTHSHWDHVGSLQLFNNAVIYSWDAEFRYANDSAFALSGFEHPNLPHRKLYDGQVVELHGRSIQSIYTPGHTSDSVSFLVDGRYLFVGDLLINLRLARYDEELQRINIEKMLRMEGVQYVFTGHFGLFRDVRFFRWWWL